MVVTDPDSYVAPVDGDTKRLPGILGRLDGRRARRALDYAAGAFLFYAALQWVWPTPAGVVLQGIILGSLTALMAYGLSLIYGANRVINFAQADLGAVPASFAVSLIIIRGWPFLLAMPTALVLAIVLGWVVQRVLIRPFAKAPRLILMVATIGLAQILVGLGTAVPFLLGADGPTELFDLSSPYPSPFDFTFEVAPIVFRGNDLISILTVPVVVIALTTFLRRSSVGTAIRASAESADRASLLGINVQLTQNVVWIVATVLATVAMLLRAGIFGLPIGSAFGPAMLLRALAAAVIGRMENYGAMFAAAVGIGVVETAIVWNEETATFIDPTLLVLIIGALLFQRRRRRTRADDQATSSWQQVTPVRPIPAELSHLREVRWGIRGLGIVLALLLVVLPLWAGDSATNRAAAVFIFAMISVSLVILTGWSGEISLGQMAFVAIGAATAGALNFHYQWDLVLTLFAAGVLGSAVAVLIGLPALRVRGLFLTVTTLAFALTTSSYLLNRDHFSYLPDNVSERVRRLPIFGRTDISSETAFYYVSLIVLGVVLWSVSRLRRTRTARVLSAARDNEQNAQAFGVNLTRVKLLAFALSGFFASMAGGLFALHQQAIGQEVFAPAESIRALTMVVIGGLGSLPGAVLGAVFLKSTEWFNTVVPGVYRTLFTFAGSGVGLLFVLAFLPGGLGQVLYGIRDRLLRVVANRHQIIVPSLVADLSTVEPEKLAGDWRLEELVAEQQADEEAEPDREAARAGKERRAPFRWFPRATAPYVDYFSFPDLSFEGSASASQLSVRAIDVAYGQVQVLFGVTMEIEAGELIALLGTNGAGKSTVLRATSGLTPARRGSIAFEGADITFHPPHKIAAEGLIQVPGGRGIFPSLSVRENLSLGGWLYRRDRAYIEASTQRILDLFPVLRAKLGDPAASLSGGQQQMLTIGMALMAKPKVLMIDELSLGLAPVIVEQLLAVVRQLNAEGVTVILVEQSVNLALTVADKAFFMEKGEVRFQGVTGELLDRPDLLRSVFLEGVGSGRPVADDDVQAPVRARPLTARSLTPVSGNGDRPVRLETVDVSKSFYGVVAISDLSIKLHEGEILGVIGPNGAGKTTLFDLVSGFQLPNGGSIFLDDRDITSLPPDARAHLGLGRSFQDARLFGSLTVAEAIAVALDQHLEVHDAIAAAIGLPDVMEAERKVARKVDELIDLMGLGAFRDKFIAELSTGSRRIVDLACQIAVEPRVILFDEPSSGIAQRETEALGPLLERIRDETGASLLVIEHDMPLVTSIADRLVALDVGRFVCEGDADTVLNHPQVVASYLGTSREVIERSGTTTVEASAVKG